MTKRMLGVAWLLLGVVALLMFAAISTDRLTWEASLAWVISLVASRFAWHNFSATAEEDAE